MFRLRCSSTNFRASSISACVSGRSRPGSVSGAPGRSSMAWSHTVCLGRRCDSCSENIFACLWYSGGIFGVSVAPTLPMVTFPMKYRVVSTGRGLFIGVKEPKSQGSGLLIAGLGLR